MRRAFAILVIALGLISSGLFFSAGSQLSAAGVELSGLSSQSGGTVAEAYYQKVGEYGVAYSKLAYALGIGTLMLSIGLGGLLLSSKENLIEPTSVS